MKKIISISLLTLVLLVSSRLTISAHYCGGELVSLEFFKNNKGCSKCGSIEKKHACCKDVSSSITSGDFNNSTIDFEFAQTIIALQAVSVFFVSNNTGEIAINKHSIESIAPPYFVKEPKYILFSSFIV